MKSGARVVAVEEGLLFLIVQAAHSSGANEGARACAISVYLLPSCLDQSAGERFIDKLITRPSPRQRR